MKPEDLVRPEILALKAYPVPSAEGMVKLDAMENPYTLPEALRRELAEVLARVEAVVRRRKRASARVDTGPLVAGELERWTHDGRRHFGFRLVSHRSIHFRDAPASQS